MPVIDFHGATRVFQNGVELDEVYHEGVLVWRKLNPGVYSVVITGSGMQGDTHTCVVEAHTYIYGDAALWNSGLDVNGVAFSVVGAALEEAD